MSTIHMLKGLPASGKTTLALQMVRDEGMKRVSKDDLRDMIHGGKYTPELETFVIKIRDAIIEQALKDGFDIVVDDTNLNPAHQEAIQKAAEGFGALLDIINIATPLEECIRRDSGRSKSVGESVIRGMYEKYLK